MDQPPPRPREDLLEKVPRAPYPGLRPFLDYEGMLMYGRRSQADDVVARLGHSGFVAVIGGSGSGKSSLIRAGVVPHLRQYGIAEVGDLWLPIVVTPGTNFAPAAPGQMAQTPITRLAWKFELALSGERSDARREAIAELLRRPGGLLRVLESYGPELDVDDAPPASACVLFVIDQFEELFDKSNSGVADARQLIERVIDHFHQCKLAGGRGRCFLALTMRSEHLNDCAGYLGLPEAINVGSYLVSRLDEQQLREAIEKPAQRFLRLRQRQAGAAGLPEAVRFEPAVVDRLVADATRIAHDPDHLPLLQHALARVWDEACRREGVGQQGVPASIRWADLLQSSTAGRAPPLADADNVLRRSLDDWGECIYARHTPEQRVRIEAVLRRLGYKDPTAGTYNQQRIQADDYEGGREALFALVEHGFVGDVNYLFWDQENPQRITLKVSHESFIRGWMRFRRLIDQEAVRVEQFALLLEACRDWIAEGESDAALLEPRQLRRLKDVGLEESPAARRDPDALHAEWRKLMQALSHVPGSDSLQALPFEKVLAFYRLSAQAQEREARRERSRSLGLAVFGGLALLAVPVVAFAFIVQMPALARAMAYLDASGKANAARLQDNYDSAGGAVGELEHLVESASTFRDGRDGLGSRLAAWSGPMLQHRPLSWLELAKMPFKASSTVEPVINAKLRAVLSKAVWRIVPELPQDASLIVERARKPVVAATCEDMRGSIAWSDAAPEREGAARGIFVTDDLATKSKSGRKSGNRLLFSATLDSAGGCELGEQMFAVPVEREPALLFDASLSYLLLALSGGAEQGQGATVAVHRIDWGNPGSDDAATILPPLTTIVDAAAAATVRRQAKGSMVARDTWHVDGGRALEVSKDEAWRIVSGQPDLLVPQPKERELRALSTDSGDATCDAITDIVRRNDESSGSGGFDTSGFRDGNYCIVLSRGRAPTEGVSFRGIDAAAGGAGGSNGGAPAPEAVILRSYARPLDRDGPGLRVAAGAKIATIDLGSYLRSEQAWQVGKPCTHYDGWIVLRRGEQQGVGVPWSTDALERLGRRVLADQHRAIDAGPLGQPAEATGRCKTTDG